MCSATDTKRSVGHTPVKFPVLSFFSSSALPLDNYQLKFRQVLFAPVLLHLPNPLQLAIIIMTSFLPRVFIIVTSLNCPHQSNVGLYYITLFKMNHESLQLSLPFSMFDSLFYFQPGERINAHQGQNKKRFLLTNYLNGT